MLRSVLARIHLALNLEQRDELAGFWAMLCLAPAVIAGLIYVTQLHHVSALFIALEFGLVALMRLFKPAGSNTRHDWTVVALAAILGVGLGALQLRAALLTKNQTYYLLSAGLALLIAYQIVDRFVLKPRAFERNVSAAGIASSRQDPP